MGDILDDNFLLRRKKEKERQRQLARERLAQRRKDAQERRRTRETAGPVPMPEDEQNEVLMQEAVIQEMEVKHDEERDLLIEVGTCMRPGISGRVGPLADNKMDFQSCATYALL